MTNIEKRIMQGSKNILRREDYRRVKKMDRSQFESFCKDIYLQGYQAGKASVPVVNIDDIKAVIAETKGIGASRLETIMKNIESKFGGNAHGKE